MSLNKKIKRTMLENKSQYLGSMALIIISCLLYTLLNLLSVNMGDIASSFEKDYAQEDASFTTATRLSNIKELESRFDARIEECYTFDYALSEDKTLRIFSKNTKVNIPAVIEGNQPGKNEILIDPVFAKANHLKIGDGIRIFDRSFHIAGFMSLPNYIYPLKSENDLIASPDTFGVAVIGKEDFPESHQGNRFYSIRFNSDNSDSEAMGARFREYLKSQNGLVTQWMDISDNKRVTYVSTKIQGIQKISSSLPIAILLLTCVLTGIVIWRLLGRESVIIGTLYAQGYRKKEIRRHYLLYPLSVALTGGIVGSMLGALLLTPMLRYMLSYFNMPVSSVRFHTVSIAAGILLPVIFLGISGAFVLYRELQYSPVELMRGGRTKGEIGPVERRLKLERFSFSTKFKIRGQLRSLSRLMFLLLGVVLATMLLLLGFTAKSSVDNLMNDNLKKTFQFQYEYVYNTLHEEQPPSGAEPFSVSTFSLQSDDKTDFKICGISPDSQYISLKDKTGADLNLDQVIITKPLAEELGIAPGETITVVNRLDAREYAVTIESVAETYIGEYIFMPISQFNGMLGFPADSYIGLWSMKKLNIPEALLYGMNTMEDSIRAFEASIQPLQATIGVIAFLSFVIGLIVIYVVTSLIIEENRANISLMKVFGYRRKEINALVLNSSAVIITIGYLIGIPLIMATMGVLFNSLTESMNLTLPVTISYLYLFAGFVVVYLTYELSKAICRKKIDKISMSEALKAGTE